MSADRSRYALGSHTSPDFGAVADGGSLVVLLPVGSVEPHGPHLPLSTDTTISIGAAYRAAPELEAVGVSARVAPAIPYGVTECAAGFAGAVSVAAEPLTAFIRAVVDGYLVAGARHVCVINNHLEPAHDAAVRAATDGLGDRASVACPLTRKWARLLSDEFKSGQCHAGRYETSLVLAESADEVNEPARAALPEVPISLSDKLRAGIDTFAAMGMDRAYAGDPAAATAAEGEAQYALLAQMIVGEVSAALGSSD